MRRRRDRSRPRVGGRGAWSTQAACPSPARSSNDRTGCTSSLMKAFAAAFARVLIARAAPSVVVAMATLGGCRNGAPSAAEPTVAVTTTALITSPRESLVTLATGATLPFVSTKVTGEGHAMGTHLAYAAFTTPALDEAHVQSLFDAATAEIVRLEKLMTTWDPASEVSQINAAAGKEPGARRAGDLRRHSRGDSRERDQRRNVRHHLRDAARPCGSSTKISTPIRLPRAAVHAQVKYVGYRHVKPDPAASTVFLDEPHVLHRARGHRQGIRGRPRVEGAARRGSRLLLRAGGRRSVHAWHQARRISVDRRNPRPARAGERLLRYGPGQRSRLQHRGRLRALLRGRRQAVPPHHRSPYRLPGDRLSQRDDLGN